MSPGRLWKLARAPWLRRAVPAASSPPSSASISVRAYSARLAFCPCLVEALVCLCLAIAGNPLIHAAAPPPDETASTNLVIGLLLPPEEPQGPSLRYGAQLAVDQANRTPGTPITLLVRGREGQWGADAVEAARMVVDDQAAALIAPPDGAASHLVLQVSGRTSIPVVALCPDTSVSATGVPWFLRLVPRTVDEAAVIFTNLNTGPRPIKRWVALVPPDRPGREIAGDLRKAASDSGCVLEKTFEITRTNLPSVISLIIKTNLEGVLLWLDPSTAGVCARLLRLGRFPGAVAGPIRLHTPLFTTAAGDALDGIVLPGLVLDDDSQQRFGAFQTVFRHQFKVEPDILAAFSFDAAALLVQVLRNTPRENLHKALPPREPLAGVTGPMQFDTAGNRLLPLRLLQADGNEFIPIPSQQQTNSPAVQAK